MPEASPNPATVLIVDDEQDHAEVMSEALSRVGHRTHLAYDLADARRELSGRRFDVIVTDLVMNGRREGLDLLREAQRLTPPPPVVMVTAINDVPTSKEAIKGGAYDYIVKPLDLDEFRAVVNRAAERSLLRQQNEVLEARLGEQGGFANIVGRSAAMQRVIRTAQQVAGSDLPVLILGESGTGKELIARAIHDHSRRRKARFVPLNCAAFNESMLEGQLFGHVKGAFTGAVSDHEGVFEHASRGTVFLDEIGDMPASMQAKLLRVLENGEVVRVGTNEPRRVDVRLVSATNRDLDGLMAERRFREDLYFRVKGVSITIPPLRERREDIPLLVHVFVRQISEKYGKPIDSVAPEAQQALMNYGWPGNVRQLRQAVESTVVLAEGPVIGLRDLPAEVRGTAGAAGVAAAVTQATAAAPSSGEASGDAGVGHLAGRPIEEVEREHIRQTLELTKGNREQAAKLLGMGERTLYRKLKDYGLS